MKRPPGPWSYIYASIVFAALALGWNALATRFGEAQLALSRLGDVFDLAARDLAFTLATMPAPEHPRIVVYGSSQIATVKDVIAGFGHSVPHAIQRSLADRGVTAEVADFSDGGQQVVESMVIQFASQQVVKPSVIVIGVSLFSMLRADVRPTLLEGLDVTRIGDAVRATIPDDAAPSVIAPLLAWGDAAAHGAKPTQKTIQQRLDERISAWLSSHVAAFANRQAMFNALIDTPIRRDLSDFLRRSAGGAKRARTYEIGSAYPSSLLALEVMQRTARKSGIPMLVVVLPFDDQRLPLPFAAATQEQLRGDLAAASARSGFQLLDSSHALGSERFGNFDDGSPDNLHFDTQGHTAMGERIATHLLPLLLAMTGAGPG